MNRLIPGREAGCSAHCRILAALVLLTAGGFLSPSVPTAAADLDAPNIATSPAWDADLKPVTIVTNGWADVREILRNVAASAGLGLQLAPDVIGQVNVHLENVAVSHALSSLLDPVDLGWEVVGGALVVHRRGLVTRWFTFDYPVTRREGRGELEVSVSREGGGASADGGQNQNSANVTSTATMSIWPEVMKSLQTLIFLGAPAPAGGGAEGGDERSLNQADNEGRCLLINPMASLVQVTAEWDRVQKVEQLLARLQESLQRQVVIEVRIMEVSLDEDTQTGVNWETYLKGDVQFDLNTLGSPPSLGEDFVQMVVDTRHFFGVMQAMASQGNLRTVSTPRVTTLNNQKAIVRVVREDVYYLATVQPAVVSNGVATAAVVSYSPQTVSVGVVLDVTPQVGRDRVITLNVHPTISDVVGVALSPNLDSMPILSVRELDTVGKVGDGQTMVIAGLISERDRVVRNGVPVLKDLPLLGMLFGSTSRQKYNVELVMLLTPVILDGSATAAMAESARAALEKKM